jgi:hypothetical protein
MRLLLHSFAAALVAVSFSLSAAPALPTAVPCSADVPSAAAWYGAAVRQPSAGLAGQPVVVAVDLASSPGFAVDDDGLLHYRMLFNDVAEGWSWQPESRPGESDYYRWKFLPAGVELEERKAYVQEEKVGEPQQTQVLWRYDYFLAFDNAYDFYRRLDDDETGFVARLPRSAVGQPIRLHALATLAPPALSESTTFWKAVHARPVDFTLKKRYLIGRLEALVVCGEDGELARIRPLPADAGPETQR